MEALSEQSRRNLSQAFESAARQSLVRQPSDVCDVTLDPTSRAQFLSQRVLLITISSFVFRLTVIFDVADSSATRTYYAIDGATGTLDEVFAEVANLCCGALNRQLSRNLLNLAMSTPYTLDSRCIGYMQELRPQFLARYAITINDAVQLRATLCMCCSAPLEIGSCEDAAAEVSGELELF